MREVAQSRAKKVQPLPPPLGKRPRFSTLVGRPSAPTYGVGNQMTLSFFEAQKNGEDGAEPAGPRGGLEAPGGNF